MRTEAVAVVIIVLIGAALRFPLVSRIGLIADEEITAFVVRGVSAHAVPTLPSGVVYDRGMPFTYAAWLFSRGSTHPLQRYRATSFIFGLLTIVLGYRAARRCGMLASVVLATCVALSPLLVMISTWARFYSLTIGLLFASLVAFDSRRTRVGSSLLFGTCAALATLTYELGFAAALVPAACACVSSRNEKPHEFRAYLIVGLVFTAAAVGGQTWFAWRHETWLWTTIVHGPTASAQFLLMPPLDVPMWGGRLKWILLGGLVGVSALLLGAGTGLPLWFRFVAAIAAATFQIGALCVALAVAVAAAPHLMRRLFLWSTATAAASGVVWIAYGLAMTGATASPATVLSLATYSLVYPTNGIVVLSSTFPATVTICLAATAVAIVSDPDHRAVVWCRLSSIMALFVLALLGAAKVSITPRMLALPILFVWTAAAAAIGWMGNRRPHRRTAIAAAIALCATAAVEPVGVCSRVPDQACTLPVTDLSGVSGLATRIAPPDIVVGNDELAARYVTGRNDYWLVTDRAIIEHYSTAGGTRGIYGGAPLLTSVNDLVELIDATPPSRSVWVVILDTRKFAYEPLAQLAIAAARLRSGVVVLRDSSATVVRFHPD